MTVEPNDLAGSTAERRDVSGDASRELKVSVVLTTYNRAHVLAATIESILHQTYQAFELIISDDCSTDNTEQVSRAYEGRDSRVRYRKNDVNLGMPGNLNSAICAARGEFVANLHDGDQYDRALLATWLAALEKCPDAAFVFNAYRDLDANGIERRVHREDLPSCFPGNVLLEEVFFRRWGFGSPVWGTVMARRSAYERATFFQQRFGFCADVDMWLRLAERHHVAYIDEPLISLPDDEVLPRNRADPPSHRLKLVEQMFWESRMRYYSARPARRAAEVIRHTTFLVLNRGYHVALRVLRRLRSNQES